MDSSKQIFNEINEKIDSYISWYRGLSLTETQDLKGSEQEKLESAIVDLVTRFIRPFYIDHQFKNEAEENEYLKEQLYDSFKKLYDYGGIELIDKLLKDEGFDKTGLIKIPLMFDFIFQDNYFDPWYFYSYTWSDINTFINLFISDLNFNKDILIVNPHVSSLLKKGGNITGFTNREKIKNTIDNYLLGDSKIELIPNIIDYNNFIEFFFSKKDAFDLIVCQPDDIDRSYLKNQIIKKGSPRMMYHKVTTYLEVLLDKLNENGKLLFLIPNRLHDEINSIVKKKSCSVIGLIETSHDYYVTNNFAALIIIEKSEKEKCYLSKIKNNVTSISTIYNELISLNTNEENHTAGRSIIFKDYRGLKYLNWLDEIKQNFYGKNYTQFTLEEICFEILSENSEINHTSNTIYISASLNKNMVTLNPNEITSKYYYSLRLKEHIVDPYFLLKYFNSKIGIKTLESNCDIGSAVNFLSKENLKKIIVFLPKYNEQLKLRAISEKLYNKKVETSQNFENLWNTLDPNIIPESKDDLVYEMLISQGDSLKNIQEKTSLIPEIDKKLDRYFNELFHELNEIKLSNKKNTEGLESVIEKILIKTDNIISFDNLESFEKKIKSWFEYWEKLEVSSKRFMPRAEYLYKSINSSNFNDYSPFILYYCRTLEFELFNKIFVSFHDYINNKYPEKNKLFEYDSDKLDPKTIEDIENGQMLNFKRKFNSPKYTLGDMRLYLNLLPNKKNIKGSKRYQALIALQELNSFINDKVGEIPSQLIKSIEIIVSKYRNPSAHIGEISKSDADMFLEEYKKLMNGLFKSFSKIKP